jgi:esterase
MQTITGFRDRTVDTRGIAFHYLEWGSAAAPPMVLLHGLTGHAHVWDHMAPQLGERFHLYALDQRGHGDSGQAPSYTTREFVDDLEAIVQARGIERFVLMGLSMGGHNAMAYAVAHPERVSRLIVIDIPARMNRQRAPGYAEATRLASEGHRRYTDFEDAVGDARPDMPTVNEENLRYRTKWNLRTFDDGTMQFKYDAKVQALWDPEDLTEKLAHIAAPTLLVRAGRAVTLPRPVAEAMAAAIPDCELLELDSAHSVPTDRPERLTPAVLDWLARRS